MIKLQKVAHMVSYLVTHPLHEKLELSIHVRIDRAIRSCEPL